MNQLHHPGNSIQYWQLSAAGTENGLSFSSYEILSNQSIGLDGIRRKILVAQNNEAGVHYASFSLAHIKSVTIEYLYKEGERMASSRRRLYKNPVCIRLMLQLSSGSDCLILNFYEEGRQEEKDLTRLEEKALRWQLMLSKLLTGPGMTPFR